MEKIRVGFIGCGSHSGVRLYPSLRSAGLELVALCDLDETRSRARASEYKEEYAEAADFIRTIACEIGITT